MNRIVFKQAPTHGHWYTVAIDANGKEIGQQFGGAGNRENALRFSAETIIREIETYAEKVVEPVLVEAAKARLNSQHGNNPPAHHVKALEKMKERSEANW